MDESHRAERESLDPIEGRILLLRGHRVIVDADLADLYGVPTKRLNEQVKRNTGRFPEDFAFRLTREEAARMRSQNANSKEGRGLSRAEFEEPNRSQFATGSQKHRDPRFLPYVFTEHGAIMAANVLNSRRAVQASVHVVRAFVRLRQALATHHELAQKLAELERKVGTHDEAIRGILAAMRQLMDPPPEPPKERIGFHPR